MRQFDLIILGSGAALPARGRHPSAQVFNANGKLYLIDCGEGTQMRLRKFGISIQKIDHVFISHLHGDHYLGLVGLVSTMHLMGREKPLKIFGPVGLQEIIDVQLKHSGTFLRFPLAVVELENSEEAIHQDKNIIVHQIPLKHRIACNGFLFWETPSQRSLKKESIEQYGLDFEQVRELKGGKDVETKAGILVKATEATFPAPRSRSYGYCSDTLYMPELAQRLKGVDLLYHEATFDDDLEKRAKETYHTTARQAGRLASKAGAGKLLIGHFSSRYKDLSVLLDQARQEFSNTHLAEEGEVFNIG